MKKFLIFIVVLALVPLLSEASAISLRTMINKVAEDGGKVAEPIGHWIGPDELEIRFIVRYEDFEQVSAESMQQQLTGDTIKLRYKIVDIPHAADAPIALCYTTRALVYDIKGIPKKQYQVEVDGPDSGTAHALPIVDLPVGTPNAIRVSVLNGGKDLLLDGKPATKEEIKDRMKGGAQLQTSIWIYADAPADTVSPIAEELMNFAIEQQVPVAIADKSDFSDVLAKLQAADKADMN